MTQFTKKMIALCFVAGAIFGANAQQMPPTPVDGNVRIGVLENGMTYYIRRNQLPENRADFYIAQKVGSIQEEDNQRGLAHFLEHMCFNGTKNFPGKTLIEYLESIGVKFGANLNAYTSIEETVYNISNVPVVRDGIVDSCLLILHDWADGLTLDKAEVDAERNVIHEEWRTRTGAMMRMYETALPEIYQGGRYGYRLPIGTMDVVLNFPHQALRDYYEKWYRPDNQGLVIVGDIDVDQVEQKIKTLFSKIEMPKTATPLEKYEVADNKELVVSISKDKEQTTSLIYHFYKHEAFPKEAKGSMEYLVVSYMKEMLANMLNARLAELRQSPTPPFLGAQTTDGNFMLSGAKGAFAGMAYSKEDGIETALAALTREIERVHRHGFTATEYARAKADYLSNLESAYNEREKNQNESYALEYVRHFIDNEPIPGIENEYAIMNQIVPNIPVEAINSLIPGLLNEENQVVAIFCPEKEGMVYPTKEGIANVIKNVKAEEITAYVDNVSDEPLIAVAPTAGKIVKTEEGAFGSTLLTLSNGVRVVIKTTDFKADEINMVAFSPGGSSLFPDSEIININAMNEVVRLGGLGNFSTIELDKVLAGKKAGVAAVVNENSEGLRGGCAPKDLETLMQLTYLNFTAPRVDQDAFTSYKNRTKASLANQESNPRIAMVDSLYSAMYSGHPRVLRMKADLVDKVDYAKIMEMYKDRFSDASDFTFVFVGNITATEAAPLIETYLGSLPATNRKESFRDTGMDMRKGNYKNIFNKEQETPKASIMVIRSGKVDYTPENRVLMNMVSQVLNLVYTESVREKEGGTYGVNVRGSVSKYPKEEGVLQISFDTNPEKREHLTNVVIRELAQFAEEGPSAENLQKVKEFMLKQYNENLKENSYWVNILDRYYWEGLDLSSNYAATVTKITANELKGFVKSLLDQNNQIEVSMTAEIK
ncbi:MAG: M16 family metallopeptidase [Phocaeicola sp.]